MCSNYLIFIYIRGFGIIRIFIYTELNSEFSVEDRYNTPIKLKGEKLTINNNI